MPAGFSLSTLDLLAVHSREVGYLALIKYIFELKKALNSIQGFHLSGKRGSNSRPQPWQGCALPTELFPLVMNAIIAFLLIYFKELIFPQKINFLR